VGSQGDGKTAIRGGYGVFFEHTNGNEANAESLEPAASPAVQTTSVFSLTAYDQIVPQPPGSSTPLAMISIPNKAVWPYVQQWHLDLQHEFFSNTVATVSYVGSKGTHLTRFIDINQLPRWRFRRTLISCMRPSDRTIAVQSIQTPMRFHGSVRCSTNATTPGGASVANGGRGSKPSRYLGIAACGTNPICSAADFRVSAL